ncbi:MAG: sulfatase [Chthoniobacterales bacterium]
MKNIIHHLAPIMVVLALVQAKAPAAPPNIVFILADDLGWSDLGCYGSTFYETPNIDRLAKESVRFTDAYAAACICSPTRASILTGKSPARLRLTDWLTGRPDQPSQKLNRPDFQQCLALGEVTIAEALRDGGYRTASIGKWHLGESPETWPEQQGFELNIGGFNKGTPPSYFSPYKIPTLTDGLPGEDLTDRLTDEALRFIESSRDKPFFLYLPYYAVHVPLQAKAEDVRKYETKAAKLPPSEAPEFRKDHGCDVRQIQNHPVYAAMVANLDENVGRLMDKLVALGLDKNTIVIFTSDNGGLSTSGGTPTSNLPLRGGKGWGYEGGTRVPLLVKWPGNTKSDSIDRAPLISADFYPTLLEMAGLPLLPDQHLDGVSLVPELQGEHSPKRPLFWHYPHYSNQGGAPHGAVRRGDFKLIEWYEDSHVELYNLRKDPGEKTDLATAEPGQTAALKTLLYEWRDQVHAQMPTPNPDYDPKASPLSSEPRH